MNRLAAVLAVLVTGAVSACSSSAPEGNPLFPDDGSSGPCGTDPYADLPACTSAREGLTCQREAAHCTPNEFTCESGAWVPTGVAGGGLDCNDASGL